MDQAKKPPPIPGMRPPLGSPGGPVPAPKSSMGFVMPIYTICIIVFFVYTLSKILFKRTGSIPYEHVAPDPQFRRRVFRDDSRTSPDSKLGPKERDAIVTAISGLVAEVHQQMEASYAQSQQRQESQENHTRPYTNGSVHSSPIIIANEYVESKEKTPEPKESSPEPKELSPEKELTPEKEPTPEPVPEKEFSPEPTPEKESSPEPIVEKEASREPSLVKESTSEPEKPSPEESEEELSPEKEPEPRHIEDDLLKLSEDIREKKENLAKSTKDFLNEAKENAEKTVELLKEALKEDSPVEEEEEEEEEEENDLENDNVSVKVMGMELTAHTASGRPATASAPAPAPAAAPAPARSHEADSVKSIFLETHIPQQSRVLVADFEDRAKPHKKHEPAVVSGKMTLSLIQDAPQDTPDLDPESTMDDFTTASAMTQPAAEKEGESSGEEIEEEIEIEEIEEEEEEEEPKPEETQK